MDGWMGMEGWMDGWADEWTHGRMSGWMDDGWMGMDGDGWVMEGWADDEWMHGRMSGWMDDGWMMDGWGWRGGRMGG